MSESEKVIKLEFKFILRCKRCGSHSFCIWLGSVNPYDIIGLECMECENEMKLDEDG